MNQRVVGFGIVVVSVLGVLALVSACTQPDQAPLPRLTEPELSPGETCAEYVRSGVKEQQCATCGDNICDPFEKCTPSSCDPYGCTEDCGPLECPEDCALQEPPQAKLPPGKLPELTASLRTCRKDTDCVQVKIDCCGCNAGGKAGAISKEFEKSWQDTLEEKCTDVVCPTVLSSDWSCTAEVKCVQNKCTLVKGTE